MHETLVTNGRAKEKSKKSKLNEKVWIFSYRSRISDFLVLSSVSWCTQSKFCTAIPSGSHRNERWTISARNLLKNFSQVFVRRDKSFTNSTLLRKWSHCAKKVHKRAERSPMSPSFPPLARKQLVCGFGRAAAPRFRPISVACAWTVLGGTQHPLVRHGKLKGAMKSVLNSQFW